jgi:hypothetical protein
MPKAEDSLRQHRAFTEDELRLIVRMAREVPEYGWLNAFLPAVETRAPGPRGVVTRCRRRLAAELFALAAAVEGGRR